MRALLLAPVLAAVLAAAPAGAQEREYAPLDQPGPALSIASEALAASLVCPVPVEGADRDPVLLVPGTTFRPQEEFDWNYLPALAADGRPHCTVELPGAALEDVQVAGEHVVFAVREVARRSGRQVDLVGHSQGGMVPRWALRFWPDVRPLVDDLVGLAPSNHGTVDSQALCQASCPAAFWQQAADAAFIDALNSRAETFAGIDYTVVYTRYDQVVVPNLDDSGSSSLRTGDGTVVNVALQDVCPANVAEHLAIGTYDPVAHALVVDALDHDGPADPDRIDPAVCTAPLMPGVDPLTFPADYAGLLTALAGNTAATEQLPAEPPLADYVFARAVVPVTSAPMTSAPMTVPAAPAPVARTLPSTGAAPTAVAALALLAAGAFTRRARRPSLRA